MVRTVLGICALWLFAVPATAATYYVDDDGGADYTSIGAGADALGAGDTLIVREGIYREEVTISSDGESGSPIVMKAVPARGAVIDGSKPVTGWTRCASDDAGLTVGGVVNVNYNSIFWAEIDEADVADVYDAILFEDSEHLFIGQYPDQINRAQDVIQDLDFYIHVAEEAYGLTDYLLDSDFLGIAPPVTPAGNTALEAYTYQQPDDYWNGARLSLYSHGINNNLTTRNVAGFVAAEHRVVFDDTLAAAISYGSDMPDAYAFINHPHTVSQAGEYYIVPTPAGGKYKIYLWPRDESDLTERISFAVRERGIYGYAARHWIIEGFEVTGHTGDGIRFRSNVAADSNHVTVRDCYVHRNDGWGIYINGAYGCVVESCDVYLSTGAGSRGIHLTGGRNGLIKDNTSIRNGSTNISYYTMKHSSIIGNRIEGAGVHGNGLSCYMHCDSVLIARNIFYPSASGITLQDFGNITIFGNLFYAPQSSHIIATWAPAHGRNVGPVTVLQNTGLSEDGSSTASLTATTYEYDGVRKPVFSFNNILGGDNGRIATDNTASQPGARGYNVYTDYGWTQSSNYGWSLNAGELDERDTDMNTIFQDTTNRDFRLPEGSPGVGAGMDLSTMLDTLGTVALFPDFDFSKDMDGNIWAATPSAGCYEYAVTGQKDVSAGGVKRQSGFGVGPLPFTDHLDIRGPGLHETGTVLLLYGTEGKLMKRVDNRIRLDTRDMPAGMYWLTVTVDSRMERFKLVKLSR